MYQLVAVSPSPHDDMCTNDAWRPIDDLKCQLLDKAITTGLCTHGDINWAEGYRMKNLPAIAKTANDGEIARWPELSAWRNSGKWFKPMTLWLRVDMIKLMEG